MEVEHKPIAVVQGASSNVIQQLFENFIQANGQSIRIVGLIEHARDDSTGCGPGHMRDLAGGRKFPIFQDLGAGSVACSLDAASLVDAGQSACAGIAAGCDLVVLSKFGKLEAESRSGLIPAFVAAMEQGIPILTSVSPKYERAWSDFASPMFVTLPPEIEALEAWWQATREIDVAG